MIERIREKTCLSRQEMIRRLEITSSYYSMLVSGERRISKNLAIKIRNEFGISLDSIFLADEGNV